MVHSSRENGRADFTIKTEGNCLVIAKAKDAKREKAFREALEDVNQRFGPALRRLSRGRERQGG